jgi:hypothetical protein
MSDTHATHRKRHGKFRDNQKFGGHEMEMICRSLEESQTLLLCCSVSRRWLEHIRSVAWIRPGAAQQTGLSSYLLPPVYVRFFFLLRPPCSSPLLPPPLLLQSPNLELLVCVCVLLLLLPPSSWGAHNNLAAPPRDKKENKKEVAYKGVGWFEWGGEGGERVCLLVNFL